MDEQLIISKNELNYMEQLLDEVNVMASFHQMAYLNEIKKIINKIKQTSSIKK